MALFAGFGNPLLDVTVKISDNSILNKYNLKEDDEKVFSTEDLKSLLNDISGLEPTLSPGGCAQNTLRILQWIFEKPNSTVMFGAIGKNKDGETLKNLIEAAGVKTMYIEHNDEETGTAVALIKGFNRSLVASLGAAQNFKMEHVESNNLISALQQTNLVYMEGFFITERLKVSHFVHEFCKQNNIIFTFNLSSVFLSCVYPNDILYLAQECDILIGNLKEYESLITNASLTSNVIELAKNLSRNYKSSKDLKYGKIIIITNGSKSVMCVHSDGVLEEFVVPKVDESKIGDTTGAGDAFAAGFLSGLFSQRGPLTSLKWGCWVAQQIIQQTGCTIPNYSANELKTIE